MRLGVALLTSAGVLSAPHAGFHYHLESLASKVELIQGGVASRAVAGQLLTGGDELRTGWRGRATVSVPERAARFAISPLTHVRLGGETPGVILLLQRGALHAIFDAMTGREPRTVATPGALLAVRGTNYAVQVDPSGEATIAVFSGTVEVIPWDPSFPPTSVEAAELCRFGPRRPPTRGPLPPTLTERNWEGHRAMRPHDGRDGGQGQPSSPHSGSPPATRRSGGRGRG